MCRINIYRRYLREQLGRNDVGIHREVIPCHRNMGKIIVFWLKGNTRVVATANNYCVQNLLHFHYDRSIILMERQGCMVSDFADSCITVL